MNFDNLAQGVGDDYKFSRAVKATHLSDQVEKPYNNFKYVDQEIRQKEKMKEKFLSKQFKSQADLENE